MAIDAIVRVSFQTSVEANQAANRALVGHAQNAGGPGPFQRINTALYQCRDVEDMIVGAALATLGTALSNFADKIDYVAITVVRRPTP